MELSLTVFEDPTDQHVMPAVIRKPSNGEKSGNSNGLMLPPTGHLSLKKRKRVLEEEQYVEALSHIIERDYFPQLAASRAQNEEMSGDLEGLSVDSFFKQYTSYDNDSYEVLQEKSVESHKRQYPWLYELPDDGTGHRRSGMLMLYYLGDNVLSAQQRNKMDAIMNGEAYVGDNRPNGSDPWRFRVRNQFFYPPELAVSEDVCRMRDHEATDLQHMARKQIQDSNHSTTVHKSILPADPNKMLQLTDASANPKTTTTPSTQGKLNNSTNNKAALQQALVRYNKRYNGNTIRSEKAIQRNNTNLTATASNSTSTLTAAQLLSWDAANRAQLTQSSIYHTSLHHPNNNKFVLEAPHTPSLRSSASSSDTTSVTSDSYHTHTHTHTRTRSRSHRHNEGRREYQTVPMSPCPEPGSGALHTPLFTWGSVEATPIVLHTATPMPLPHSGRSSPGRNSSSPVGVQANVRLASARSAYMKSLQERAFTEVEQGLPTFEMKPASRREVLARTIDTASVHSHTQAIVKRRTQQRHANTSSGSTSSTSSNRGSVNNSIQCGSGNQRIPAVESSDDVSDEISVTERKNYYKSANRGVVAAHTHHTSSRAHDKTTTASYSTAQRLAMLTPAARALALKLHKNLIAPTTPLN